MGWDYFDELGEFMYVHVFVSLFAALVIFLNFDQLVEYPSGGLKRFHGGWLVADNFHN